MNSNGVFSGKGTILDSMEQVMRDVGSDGGLLFQYGDNVNALVGQHRAIVITTLQPRLSTLEDMKGPCTFISFALVEIGKLMQKQVDLVRALNTELAKTAFATIKNFFSLLLFFSLVCLTSSILC